MTDILRTVKRQAKTEREFAAISLLCGNRSVAHAHTETALVLDAAAQEIERLRAAVNEGDESDDLRAWMLRQLAGREQRPANRPVSSYREMIAAEGEKQ